MLTTVKGWFSKMLKRLIMKAVRSAVLERLDPVTLSPKVTIYRGKVAAALADNPAGLAAWTSLCSDLSSDQVATMIRDMADALLSNLEL